MLSPPPIYTTQTTPGRGEKERKKQREMVEAGRDLKRNRDKG